MVRPVSGRGTLRAAPPGTDPKQAGGDVVVPTALFSRASVALSGVSIADLSARPGEQRIRFGEEIAARQRFPGQGVVGAW